MILKYIIVDSGAILFPESIVHSMVAKNFPKVYSAGFVRVNPYASSLKPLIDSCWGESESLKIKSIPKKDIEIIRDLLNPTSSIKYFGFNVKEFYETI